MTVMTINRWNMLLLLWLLLATAPHLWRSFKLPIASRFAVIYKLPWNELPWGMFVHSYGRIEIQRVVFLDNGQRRSLSAIIGTPALGYRESRLIDNTTNKNAYRRHLCSILPPGTRLETEIWRRTAQAQAGQPSYQLVDIRHECTKQP